VGWAVDRLVGGAVDELVSEETDRLVGEAADRLVAGAVDSLVGGEVDRLVGGSDDSLVGGAVDRLVGGEVTCSCSIFTGSDAIYLFDLLNYFTKIVRLYVHARIWCEGSASIIPAILPSKLVIRYIFLLTCLDFLTSFKSWGERK
jgi:hypothetical protein